MCVREKYPIETRARAVGRNAIEQMQLFLEIRSRFDKPAFSGNRIDDGQTRSESPARWNPVVARLGSRLWKATILRIAEHHNVWPGGCALRYVAPGRRA